MLLSALILIGACVRRGADQEGAELTAGDPARGRVAIVRYGCGACHAIPGVSNAKGLVGPPLSGIANRAYIGGVLGNTPDNMIEWLRNPQAVSPKTAMPNLHVSERDARDIASYLYTLK
ncbi:MAG TPA: c-type cytochrome [Blastocatellia bacterium]|nr:c-type cytochrome [Blastocatellia bacterium]